MLLTKVSFLLLIATVMVVLGDDAAATTCSSNRFAYFERELGDCTTTCNCATAADCINPAKGGMCTWTGNTCKRVSSTCPELVAKACTVRESSAGGCGNTCNCPNANSCNANHGCVWKSNACHRLITQASCADPSGCFSIKNGGNYNTQPECEADNHPGCIWYTDNGGYCVCPDTSCGTCDCKTSNVISSTFDSRSGGCGHTCNCPNEHSCTNGTAKDNCIWTSVGCQVLVPKATCGNGNRNKGCKKRNSGGCGNSCNCPNEVSCGSGVPKVVGLQCQWLDNQCWQVIDDANADQCECDDVSAEDKATCYKTEATSGPCHAGWTDLTTCVEQSNGNCAWTGTSCVRIVQGEGSCKQCDCLATETPTPTEIPSETRTSTQTQVPSETRTATQTPEHTETLTPTATELATCIWDPVTTGGCGNNCNCKTVQACMNNPICSWSWETGCSKIRNNTRCAYIARDVCTQLEHRKGGCGNTCNCPNQVSCESGAAKDQCVWRNNRCERMINAEACATGTCLKFEKKGTCGKTCNCQDQDTCEANADTLGCVWTGENCVRETKGATCQCSCSGADGKFCRGYDDRLGGCGNTCNCPNAISCTSGLAKEQCDWDDEAGACVRINNRQRCVANVGARTCHIFEKRSGKCGPTCNCNSESNCKAASAKCAWTGESCVRKVTGPECDCNCEVGVCYLNEFHAGKCGDTCNCTEKASCLKAGDKCSWTGSKCVMRITDSNVCGCRCAKPTCGGFVCPTGKKLKANPEFISCANDQCTHTQCCDMVTSSGTNKKAKCSTITCAVGQVLISKTRKCATDKCTLAECCRTTNTCAKFSAKKCGSKKLKANPATVTCATKNCTTKDCCQ